MTYSPVLLALLLLPGAAPAQAPAPVGVSLARAAARQVGVTLRYDPGYVRLAYPNGDVPIERGVCADVIVRAFRAVGVDLQKEVHEDMRRSFAAYPRNWGLRAPDRNIDHRRVPNLMKYFERRGRAVPAGGAVEPGDVVAWRLPGGLYHIGIAAEERVPGSRRPFMVHNIGSGARKEDVLRAFEIIGHYRWKSS